MKNSVVRMYEKQKAERQKWLDENECLKNTTMYQGVLLGIAFLDIGIAMAEKFGDSVDSALSILSEMFK
jgi:hypothetical protein